MVARLTLVFLVLVAGCSDSGDDAKRLPRVVDVGGPRLAHPQLVPIFYSDDPDAVSLIDYEHWIVGSQWLRTVGTEYGIAAGTTLPAIRKLVPAPPALSDAAIVDVLYQDLADHTLPAPGPDTLYVFHVPRTTIIADATSTSCVEYLAYHSSARRDGVEIVYAVIPTCTSPRPDDYTDFDYRELGVSHELIEAATDPFPSHRPGFQLRDPTSTWSILGGEVADLCAGVGAVGAREGSYLAQRSWSNAAAETGDPCVPLVTSAPYFNVFSEASHLPRAHPGDKASIDVTGWTTGDLADWQLQAQAGPPGDVALELGDSAINAGKTRTLDITIPDTTPKGTITSVYLFSIAESGTYQLLPMSVVVDDDCASFTDCESCASHPGCGFCASSGRCETEGVDGSDDSRCPAADFATWQGSCPGFCAAHAGSCTDCASQGGCGWCGDATTGRCLEASPGFAEPRDGSCAYADWNFTPSYCPAPP